MRHVSATAVASSLLIFLNPLGKSSSEYDLPTVSSRIRQRQEELETPNAKPHRRDDRGRHRDEREDGEDFAPSVVNASESGLPREGTLSHGGDLQTTQRRESGDSPPRAPPDITPLPGTRQHPEGVSRIGVLGLHQRPLADRDSLKQAPCRELRLLSHSQQRATGRTGRDAGVSVEFVN
jgi:hypothetical protein